MAERGTERIVVGVDGSEQAAAAVEWAIRIAKGIGSEVIAVFAIDMPPWLVEPDVMLPPPVFDPEWRKAMQEAFEGCDRWVRAFVMPRTLSEHSGWYQNVLAAGREA